MPAAMRPRYRPEMLTLQRKIYQCQEIIQITPSVAATTVSMHSEVNSINRILQSKQQFPIIEERNVNDMISMTGHEDNLREKDIGQDSIRLRPYATRLRPKILTRGHFGHFFEKRKKTYSRTLPRRIDCNQLVPILLHGHTDIICVISLISRPKTWYLRTVTMAASYWGCHETPHWLC